MIKNKSLIFFTVIIIIIILICIIVKNKKNIEKLGGYEEYSGEYEKYNIYTYNTLIYESSYIYNQIEKDIKYCQYDYMRVLSNLKYKNINVVAKIFDEIYRISAERRRLLFGNFNYVYTMTHLLKLQNHFNLIIDKIDFIEISPYINKNMILYSFLKDVCKNFSNTIINKHNDNAESYNLLNMYSDKIYNLSICASTFCTDKYIIVGPEMAFTFNVGDRKFIIFGDIHSNLDNSIYYTSHMINKYIELFNMYEKNEYKFSKTSGNILTIDEFLYNVGNNGKECIDVFIENEISQEKETIRKWNVPCFLTMANYLLFPCSKIFLKNPEKYDACKQLFNSIRSHEIDIRNNPQNIYYNYDLNIEFIDDCTPILKNYLEYAIGMDVKMNSQLQKLLKDNKDVLDSKLDLLQKSFKKSMFVGNEEKLINMFTTLYSKRQNIPNLIQMLLNSKMELYTLARMFVISYAEEKINRSRLTDKCKKCYYPKNIIYYGGSYHAENLTNIIKNYFNIQYKKPMYFKRAVYFDKDELFSF